MLKDIELIVTRHSGLLVYLRGMGVTAPAIPHADPKDVRGKHICGVVTLSLAAHAKSVTVVPLRITNDMRGRELTYDEVRMTAGKPQRYVVKRVK